MFDTYKISRIVEPLRLDSFYSGGSNVGKHLPICYFPFLVVAGLQIITQGFHSLEESSTILAIDLVCHVYIIP